MPCVFVYLMYCFKIMFFCIHSVTHQSIKNVQFLYLIYIMSNTQQNMDMHAHRHTLIYMCTHRTNFLRLVCTCQTIVFTNNICHNRLKTNESAEHIHKLTDLFNNVEYTYYFYFSIVVDNALQNYVQKTHLEHIELPYHFMTH